VATRIISIIGRKNAGKTTLTVALASELVRRGHRVMTMKHADHPAQVDQPGVDSWRHFHEGRAERVLLVSPDMRALFHRAPEEYDPIGLAREYLPGADIVLVEGFKQAPIPKIAGRSLPVRCTIPPGATRPSGWRSSPTTTASMPTSGSCASTTPCGSSSWRTWPGSTR